MSFKFKGKLAVKT